MHLSCGRRIAKSSLKKETLSFLLMVVMLVSMIAPLATLAATEEDYQWGPHNGTDAVNPGLTDVTLASLTRTSATVAEAGNQFNADSGVYAGVSNITAWNNNTQITIGGSGRTPIVINNAAAGAWRSVGPAAVDAGVTVELASAFQIKFSTTGYQNIRFSDTQKSTGSGPESFQLAYSIGSPTGPYIVIENSRHNNVRVGNDTYNALAPAYVDFALPAEVDDQAEVYLRVYMVDSTLSNRSNGNTSINDIVIIGDETDGGPILGGGKLIINQVFAGGGKEETPFTNSFIELYNPTKSAIDIDGWKITYSSNRNENEPGQHAGTTYGEIRELIIPSDLAKISTVIPPYHSFLIIGAAEAYPDGNPEEFVRYQILDIADYTWDQVFDNDTSVEIIVYDSDGEKADALSTRNRDFNDIGEGNAPAINTLSKQQSIRRVNFVDTDTNFGDFILIRWNSYGINLNPTSSAGLQIVLSQKKLDAFIDTYRPRSLSDGSWTENIDVNDLGFDPDPVDPGVDGAVLMSLTRTAANAAADPGNQFNADEGIFVNVSNLTAWNNNEQKNIGYLGSNRTPIVFNNAAAGAWRSVGPAAVDAGVTVETASAFQIKFETTGYQNVRFSASQKSTGSGPESFQLAYSIGSPTGPYTVIENSKHNNVRVGNDTYAALQPSYTDFPLPVEVEDQSEVYLRLYMVDSTLSDRSNGNTSINDIVIVGDGAGGSGIVVDKTALTALIAQASELDESVYTAASWAVFAVAFENAQDVAENDEARQSEVNTARGALQAAMNALKLLSEVVDVIDWPGNGTIEAWDTTRTFLEDSSGLDFHNGQLYLVDNGTGRFWIMDVAADGSLRFAEGFENGKRARFQKDTGNPSAKGPDAEGISVDDNGFVYIASERDNNNSNVNYNVILQIDPKAPGTDLVAIQEWDLTASLPQVSANTGIEAVEWVPNAEVAGLLFDKNINAAFDSGNYPDAVASGVFFVALEADGHIYAYVLNSDGSSLQIADIDVKIGGAMALDYDVYEHVLWAMADNGFGNLSAKITFTGESKVGLVHVNPPSGLDVSRNYEGFAIAEARFTVDGQRPVYRFEDGVSVGSLTIGSIDCDYVEDVHEHDFSLLVGHKDATCEEDGYDTFRCSGCDETNSIVLYATGHDWSEEVTDPTCDEQGFTTHVCANDAEHNYIDNYVSAVGHDWDEGVVTKVPTVYEEGEMTYTCRTCGDTRTEPIPALPEVSDVEFLRDRAADILIYGLSTEQLQLNGKTLTLVLDGREFVLSANANNRNISGEVALGDGYYLVFDLKGNGSNIKEFRVVQK